MNRELPCGLGATMNPSKEVLFAIAYETPTSADILTIHAKSERDVWRRIVSTRKLLPPGAHVVAIAPAIGQVGVGL
jgi:hypothetical protein